MTLTALAARHLRAEARERPPSRVEGYHSSHVHLLDGRSRVRAYLRSEAGQQFCERQASKERPAATAGDDEAAGRLGQCLAMIGKHKEALVFLEMAASNNMDDRDEGTRTGCGGHSHWDAELARVRKEAAAAEQAAALMMAADAADAFTPARLATAPIPRVDGRTLSRQQFEAEYGSRQRPVILTGLDSVTSVPWDLRYLARADLLGGCKVAVKREVSSSANWARLHDEAQTTTIGELVDAMKSRSREGRTSAISAGAVKGGAARSSRRSSCEKSPGYLHDWSIPRHAPSLLPQIAIPIQFADDLLQGARRYEEGLYVDTWPSLFIGPEGSRSCLHVDSFASSFWMKLFEGRKDWLIWPSNETCLLSPSYFEGSMDPIFDAIEVEELLKRGGGGSGGGGGDGDGGKDGLAAPNAAVCRALQTHPWRATLMPGEVLFVPSGCPHRVVNLDDTLALSANFVGEYHAEASIAELELSPDLQAKSLARALRLELNRRHQQRRQGQALAAEAGAELSESAKATAYSGTVPWDVFKTKPWETAENCGDVGGGAADEVLDERASKRVKRGSEDDQAGHALSGDLLHDLLEDGDDSGGD